jgi:hypothetical protein
VGRWPLELCARVLGDSPGLASNLVSSSGALLAYLPGVAAPPKHQGAFDHPAPALVCPAEDEWAAAEARLLPPREQLEVLRGPATTRASTCSSLAAATGGCWAPRPLAELAAERRLPVARVAMHKDAANSATSSATSPW